MVPAERGAGAARGGLILRYGLAAAALAAAIYSTILASAAILIRHDTAASVSTAVRLVPDNSAYLVRLAAWDAPERTVLLKRAVALNPFEVQAWFRLGLDAEMTQQDGALAEHYYLEAASVDHLFLPKWTLANFYFRQEREPEFLKWAKATLEISPYSADPVFAEMWLLDPNPVRLGEAVPDRPSVLWQYAWFLSNARQFVAIPPVVQRLVHAAGNGNPESYGLSSILGPVEDRLLANGDEDLALDIWRTLSTAGWVKLPVPSPAHPLTNADFKVPFWQHGFDWVEIAGSGVAINRDQDAGAVYLEFPGDEPERCSVLQQWVPLAPGKAYRLSWRAAVEGSTKPLGITWHLHSSVGGDSSSADVLAKARGQWTLRAGGNGTPLLSLEYARPYGETRAKGILRLADVLLQPVE